MLEYSVRRSRARLRFREILLCPENHNRSRTAASQWNRSMKPLREEEEARSSLHTKRSVVTNFAENCPPRSGGMWQDATRSGGKANLGKIDLQASRIT